MMRWAVEAMLDHPAVTAVRVVIGSGQDALAAAALDGLDVGQFITGGTQYGFKPLDVPTLAGGLST